MIWRETAVARVRANGVLRHERMVSWLGKLNIHVGSYAFRARREEGRKVFDEIVKRLQAKVGCIFSEQNGCVALVVEVVGPARVIEYQIPIDPAIGPIVSSPPMMSWAYRWARKPSISSRGDARTVACFCRKQEFSMGSSGAYRSGACGRGNPRPALVPPPLYQ